MVAEEYQDGWMRGINLRDLQVRGVARKHVRFRGHRLERDC